MTTFFRFVCCYFGESFSGYFVFLSQLSTTSNKTTYHEKNDEDCEKSIEAVIVCVPHGVLSLFIST